jgi:hypothetical protein
MANVEKNEADLQKEKVLAMRNAAKNMEEVLFRIDRLETKLSITIERLEEAAKLIPHHFFPRNSQASYQAQYLAYAADARTIL